MYCDGVEWNFQYLFIEENTFFGILILRSCLEISVIFKEGEETMGQAAHICFD